MMERLLQHGGWLKVISVGLAILLWATVVPRYTRQENRSFDVPLHVLYHPDFQIDEGPREGERKVSVTVRGPNHLIERLKEQEIRAEADYRRVTDAGKLTPVQVNVTGPEQWKQSLTYTVEPATINVVLVAQAETVVPLKVDRTNAPVVVVQGGREWTYTADTEVKEIRLRGRSDMLKDVVEARVVLEAADLVPGTATVPKNVIPMDARGKSVDKINQASANVTIAWKELPPGKTAKVQ
ncbi:MAG TPA: hypothetical protein VD902_11800, partial [Symbiobacteriaceae bacterium]|nr:hypothetical protein [Symbiobacteriaceae bacterium]